MDQYLAILKFTVLLLLVVLLAYFSIKYGLRRLQPSYGQEHVKIVQRVSLDVKGERSLILIRVARVCCCWDRPRVAFRCCRSFPMSCCQLKRNRCSGRGRLLLPVAGALPKTTTQKDAGS